MATDNQNLYCEYSGLPSPSSYIKQVERKRKRSREIWNRCDSCGRFISYKDFATGKAVRKLITPDSKYSKEEYSTLCSRCCIDVKIG